MAKGKGKRPPKKSSPAVSYAAERAAARSEGRDPEAVPLPPELGKPPAGSMDAAHPDVIARARAEGAAAERARIEGEKARKAPVRYSQALADRILARLEAGESVTKICQSPDMPDKANVIRWAHDPDHPFSQQYARARPRGYRLLAEEIMDIADEEPKDATAVNHQRLRIDTRKWLLAKMLPKEYGEKLELAGDPSKPLFVEVRRTVVDPSPHNQD